MMPDGTVLKDSAVSGIPLRAWFDALNTRIREHVGRDARNLQIGHSYLMQAGSPLKDFASLKRAFRDDIIPLLEEYCYEDYTTLATILGDQLVDSAAQRICHELFDDGQESDLIQALLAPCPEISASSEAVSSEESTLDVRRMPMEKTRKGKQAMSEDVVSITLSEWETLSPTTCDELAGFFLESSPSSQRVADALNTSRMLRLTELKNGLEVSSLLTVGRVRVGNLNITILPKLKAASLLRLLRYAYGFRRLELISDSTHLVDQCGFEDLLISQLNAEAQELISRGLQRAYVRQDERLASPRGRINIDRLALDGGTATATLPCQHFPRLEDTLLNRVLLAGLRLAGSVASLLDLRRESRRLASLMEEQVISNQPRRHDSRSSR